MRRALRQSLCLLLLVTVSVPAFGPAWSAAAASRGAESTTGYRIVLERSTPEEITFRYVLSEPPSLMPVEEDHGLFTRVVLPGGQSPFLPGAPDIAEHAVRLGVPAEGSLLLSVIVGEEERIRLEYPVRRVPRDPDFPEAWPAAAESPGMREPAELGAVGEFRGLRVAAVTLRPVRLDATRGELRVVREMRVTVAVGPAARGDRRSAVEGWLGAEGVGRAGDPWLSSVVINWDTARRWLRPATSVRPLERTVPRGAGAGPPAGQSTPRPALDEYFDSSSNWCRVLVSETGLHVLTYEDLQRAGIDPPDLIWPSTLRLFNGGGLALPESLGLPRREWMEECAIGVQAADSTSFRPGDRLLFYALGPRGWEVEYDSSRVDPSSGWSPYAEHPYSRFNVYWLTWEEGGEVPSGFSGGPRRIAPRSAPGVPGVDPAYADSAFYEHVHYEQNILENFRTPFADGWYWTSFAQLGRLKAFRVQHPDAVRERTSRVRVNLLGYAEPQDTDTQYHYAAVAMNDQTLDVRRVGTRKWSNETSVVFDSTGSWLSAAAESSTVWIAVYDSCRLAECDSTSEASDYYSRDVYLNWIELEYWRGLRARGNELVFTAPTDVSGAVEYAISGFSDTTSLHLLDITDPFRVEELANRAWQFQNGSWTLTVRDWLGTSGILRRYLAVTGVNYASPDSMGLRILPAGQEGEPLLRRPHGGVDYLIVTHSSLLPAAEVLAAHRAQEFRVQVVTTESVVDEFGWGLMDPTALRDFARYAFRNWRDAPGTPDLDALLLLGDTSKDFLERNESDDPILVPSYEGRYLLPRSVGGGMESDYPADDWFAYTDTSDFVPDFAVGRMPVRTLEEASLLVNKTIAYETDPEWGEWRRRIVLCADDEYHGRDSTEAVHTRDTEDLAVNYIPPEVEIHKLYMADQSRYPMRGGVKPEAQQAFKDALDEGALYLNYIGHGDETRLADERLFEWDGTYEPANGRRRPIMVILSCSVGKFDISRAALAEIMLLREGGLEAAFTSTFLALMSVNKMVAQRFYARTFDAMPMRRLGEAVLLAKADLLLGPIGGKDLQSDMERYTVLGDPGLHPGWPTYEVTFDPVVTSDSLVRQGKSLFKGSVQTDSFAPDSVASWFTGEGMILVRASADTSGHDYVGGHISYTMPGPPVFWGHVTASGGSFGYGVAPGEGEFYVAKDAPPGELGRISAYVFDQTHQVDATGSIPQVRITRTLAVGDSLEGDTQGPSIELRGPGGEPLVDGATLLWGSTFTAILTDEHGINATGADPFYTLAYQLDGGSWTDLTRDFRVDAGGFTRGRISFTFPSSVPPGVHRLAVRAADNLNNRSRVELGLSLALGDRLQIEHAFSYPNPFRENTAIIYELTRPARVRARVYTAAGRLIRVLEEEGHPGQNSTLIWDGRDDAGDAIANGVYFVRIEAREEEGGKALVTATTRAARIR